MIAPACRHSRPSLCDVHHTASPLLFGITRSDPPARGLAVPAIPEESCVTAHGPWESKKRQQQDQPRSGGRIAPGAQAPDPWTETSQAPEGATERSDMTPRGALAIALSKHVLPHNGCRILRMKAHTEYLTFHTRKHREYVHITPQVESAVKKSGVAEGMVLVSAMHITAGVYVNDHESGLIEDIDEWLEGLAPFRQDYKHHNTGEDNGDSHLKALLIHHQVIVPITKGRLDLGTWQRIFYAEFDGQRDKRVIVKVMGE